MTKLESFSRRDRTPSPRVRGEDWDEEALPPGSENRPPPVLSSPPGLTRWSMLTCRDANVAVILSESSLRMDCRVIRYTAARPFGARSPFGAHALPVDRGPRPARERMAYPRAGTAPRFRLSGLPFRKGALHERGSAYVTEMGTIVKLLSPYRIQNYYAIVCTIHIDCMPQVRGFLTSEKTPSPA
jgi:hypothetical protein